MAVDAEGHRAGPAGAGGGHKGAQQVRRPVGQQGNCRTRLLSSVPFTFLFMPDDTLRPASRESALFAIGFALNTKHGHQLAAHVAAEVVLAAIERQGMVVMQKPPLPMPGVGPKGRGEP